MSDRCAPGKGDKITCFSMEQLNEMAMAYNKYIAKKNLSLNQSRVQYEVAFIDIKPDKRYLLKELMNRFNTVCNGDEACLTKQAFMNDIMGEMKKDIKNNTFRVEGPNGTTEWLSTTDIDGIMKQYEEVYHDFIFLGAVPRDCSKFQACALYNTDFASYERKGKKRIGIIFNHDGMWQSGSHWVALYLNLETGDCYYCDSVGDPPKPDVKEYIDKFKQYMTSKGGNINNRVNKQRYQKDGSECGVYSCNFLIRVLKGEDFDSIVANPLPFPKINSCRNIYFRNGKSKYTPDPLCEPDV